MTSLFHPALEPFLSNRFLRRAKSSLVLDAERYRNEHYE